MAINEKLLKEDETKIAQLEEVKKELTAWKKAEADLGQKFDAAEASLAEKQRELEARDKKIVALNGQFTITIHELQ